MTHVTEDQVTDQVTDQGKGVAEIAGAVPCQHIADYYQRLWEGQHCIAYNLLRHGYSAWSEGIAVFDCRANNLYPSPETHHAK